MALLEIESLSAYYGMARSLNNVSLSVNEGEIVAIIGPNGAGKSTLFDSIMGMTRTTGSIRLNGVELTAMQPADIVRLGVGYAPERAHLFPYMSVRDNLLVGAYTARGDIDGNLALVHGLFPVLLERRNQETSTQSGGERQMCSLGRALMTSPKVLLVDEPTIGLAPKICNDIAAALRKLNRETGLTIVITEQNVNFAMTLAGYLHVLETGEIRTRGTVAELQSDEELNRAYFGQ
ncbi:ABC transporter ATP-binding protein [Microbaculum marinisediminis]|uniref:ABC transporter ATP-binding protein n=1 Tax=Microbaculum marinisediminis TaxID=2931392 RepID=A0AAW5QVT9_9HYPH|nr:ABC transporter ATP-binding protein [Microbaculum sp. A6E488]MCT8971125.1 ABC transporter ATP-binding protein [Microbaculum sp. A6E488]